jgi:NAD(P)-dependent dehydrogenase (short-subunit alcohol dehydrogenase family)
MKLQGRVAIVTGAGGGLGRAHALILARHGAKVVVNDLGDAADQVAAEIQTTGGEALAARGSVADEAQVETVVRSTMNRFGRIDILVNNAGILRDKSFTKMSLEDFRLVVDVHLMGSAVFTKAVWDIMRDQHYGRIVMTTSSSGLYGNFGQANYGAAKMALVGLMQTLSLEGASRNIRVNCLAPTATTAMTAPLFADEIKEHLRPELVSPGLIQLVGEDAPTRTILCAGAGHFKTANITLTAGAYIGAGDDAAEDVGLRWPEITDRTGETVPENAGAQINKELAAAAAALNLS